MSDHTLDAIHWNPYNRVVQCHRCGHTMLDPYHVCDATRPRG
jgi:hypothetical protein